MYTNLNLSLNTSIHLGLGDDSYRYEAVKVFNQVLNRGRLRQFWARLLGKPNRLQTLGSQPVASHRTTSQIVSVAINQIKGSLGRSNDFDASFNPLHERSRSRWISVAAAMRQHVPLPPVELLQVGDSFFVRDGHHRISVARAFGQEAIEAYIVG